MSTGTTEPTPDTVALQPGRRIAIGDVHGCVHALEALLDAIVPAADDVIVQLGDFIDTGRDTRDVVERLVQLAGECELVTLLGNHEEMLLGALEQPRLLEQWMNCGGIATCNSYRFCGGIGDIPDEHLDFVRGCREWYETESHLLVHANYDPDRPVEAFEPHTLRWSLLDDPEPRPHVSGKRVVVGHTEQRDGEILDLGPVVCIDTYCHGHGWLTALDLDTGETWQASRWGALREREEDSVDLQRASVILGSLPFDAVSIE